MCRLHIVFVENYIKELGIKLSFEDIKSMKKDKFGDIVEQVIEEKALKYLNSIKLKHTKVLHIVHRRLCMQEYLKPHNLINLSKFIFHARTRRLDCKTNFSNGYKNEEMNCPLQCQNQDTQKHLLVCGKIDDQCISGLIIPEYDDLFGVNVDKQMKIEAMLQERFLKRKKIIAKGFN